MHSDACARRLEAAHDNYLVYLVSVARARSWFDSGSMAVDPTGKVVAGPLVDEEGIIYVDVDPLIAIQDRQNLDISGHYSRFDIFNRPI